MGVSFEMPPHMIHSTLICSAMKKNIIVIYYLYIGYSNIWKIITSVTDFVLLNTNNFVR